MPFTRSKAASVFHTSRDSSAARGSAQQLVCSRVMGSRRDGRPEPDGTLRLRDTPCRFAQGDGREGEAVLHPHGIPSERAGLHPNVIPSERAGGERVEGSRPEPALLSQLRVLFTLHSLLLTLHQQRRELRERICSQIRLQ